MKFIYVSIYNNYITFIYLLLQFINKKFDRKYKQYFQGVPDIVYLEYRLLIIFYKLMKEFNIPDFIKLIYFIISHSIILILKLVIF